MRPPRYGCCAGERELAADITKRHRGMLERLGRIVNSLVLCHTSIIPFETSVDHIISSWASWRAGWRNSEEDLSGRQVGR